MVSKYSDYKKVFKCGLLLLVIESGFKSIFCMFAVCSAMFVFNVDAKIIPPHLWQVIWNLERMQNLSTQHPRFSVVLGQWQRTHPTTRRQGEVQQSTLSHALQGG